MKRHSIFFVTERKIEIVEAEIPALESGQVLVRSINSAISPGTEMLVYRGQAPQEMAADESIAALGGNLKYPLKYGYAIVGEVVELGAEVDPDWLGRQVFAFNPHENYFVAQPEQLLAIPEGISVEDAVFLPNMETAVNFAMDGQPLIGEKVAVFGQGIVGLLTAALLARYPLESLITFDLIPHRRELSLANGAQESFDPREEYVLEAAKTRLSSPSGHVGADLVYELSGAPAALDQAITVTGFNGRVVVGSWYGQKRANLDLGGYFHRSRIKLISSQVSTLAPELSGCWTKARRFNLAWKMIAEIKPSKFITQRFSLDEAAAAYQLIDTQPEKVVQVVFTNS
ncbi:MAG: zinc-binding alcohol dehydrogenase [Anaerolineales bacterium]|nr:zinc-binding alcohol dehydrogenase [Anaerolineales bacterium]